MNRVNSRYKILGGFGLLLGLNTLIGFGTYKLLTSSKISLDKVNFIEDPNALYAYIVIIGLFLLFLALLATQCRYLVTDDYGITFINPVLPFIRKRRQWTDFDFFITVDEDSQYSSHEAVWLIRNEKIEGRFSSFYYTNYKKLKNQVKTENKGKKHYGPFGQLFALLGIKKIKN